MMIPSDETLTMPTNPQDCSLCAALQAIIAYSDGQENSRITVSMDGGRVILEGEVETLASFECAVFIAECFTSRPVIADLSIRPRAQVLPAARKGRARQNYIYIENRSAL